MATRRDDERATSARDDEARDDEARDDEARDDDIVAAVDRSDAVARLVIADVSTDDAWLSTTAPDALSLAAWR